MAAAQVVNLDDKKELNEFEAMAECVRVINRVKGPDAQERVTLYLQSRYVIERSE